MPAFHTIGTPLNVLSSAIKSPVALEVAAPRPSVMRATPVEKLAPSDQSRPPVCVICQASSGEARSPLKRTPVLVGVVPPSRSRTAPPRPHGSYQLLASPT